MPRKAQADIRLSNYEKSLKDRIEKLRSERTIVQTQIDRIDTLLKSAIIAYDDFRFFMKPDEQKPELVQATQEPKPERPKRIRKVKDDGDELKEMRSEVSKTVAQLENQNVFARANLELIGLDFTELGSWSLEDCRKALAAMRDMKPGKEAAA